VMGVWDTHTQKSRVIVRKGSCLQLQDPHPSKYSCFLKEARGAHQPAILLPRAWFEQCCCLCSQMAHRWFERKAMICKVFLNINLSLH